VNFEVDTAPPCREIDPEAFFPDPNVARTNFTQEAGAAVLRTTITALEACARCPMQKACLQFAMDNQESYGIWGGTFPHERDAVSKLPSGQPTALPYSRRLRQAVLEKKASLVCPPISKPLRKPIPIDAYLPSH
jgi:WhiB family redox-sensing transcriptional regulator